MSKVAYKLEKVDGRYYFTDGAKYVLIDTGYGKSVSIDGTIGPFKVNHEDAQWLQSFNPTIMPDGSKIGASLWPQTGFSCLLKDDSVTIDDNAQKLPEHEWFLPYVMTKYPKPLLECKVDGKKKQLFFDSGMRLPVLDDMSLIAGKEKLGEIDEWIGGMHLSAKAPYYDATFDFPCGFRFNGHFEYDYSQMFIQGLLGNCGINGFLGIEFFNQYDLFISAVKGKFGLAIIKR